MINPIYFETTNHNKYIYDNSTRMVLPVNNYNITNEHIKDSTIIDERLLTEIQKDYPDIPLFADINIKEQQEELLNHCFQHVHENGIRQLILMITEQCNFRCNYCIYSDMYSYSRYHSFNSMSWSIAKKSIDYYMAFNKESLTYNPTLLPCIGFYGGEALINWNLIVKVVNYVESNYRKTFNNLMYSITTNGSLMDREKIIFMLEHNFFINISIDGYKENHNRNRKYVSGKATFEDIMKNISILEEEFKKRNKPEKNLTSYQFVMTYDNETSINKLIEEADKNSELYAHFARMSKVRGIDTNYYSNQCSETRINNEIAFHIKKYMQNETKNKIAEILYKQNVLIPAFNTQFSNNISGGTCIAGEKLAVSSDGKFYICEKIDYQSPIGDVDHGLDFKLQHKYLKEYFDMRNKHCIDCNLSNICNQCYSQCSNGDGNFNLNLEMCEKMKKNAAQIFSIYYTARENRVDFI